MSADNMIILTKMRKDQIVLVICNSEGDEMGKRRIYPLDRIIDAIIEAEHIMQTNDIEFGIRPIGFIKKHE